jgi:hypothetical protein
VATPDREVKVAEGLGKGCSEDKGDAETVQAVLPEITSG